MNMPDQGSDSTIAQVLIKLGEMGTQLAVIQAGMAALPDHENRLRVLERGQNRAFGWALGAGSVSGISAGIISALLTRH